MGDIPTIAVKTEDGGYAIINESDFDSAKHTRYEGVLPRDTVTDLTTRNTDGTFSEPTPTDIRFPNKDLTEFANNHGATVGKSAAEMRAAKGLPDAPGGLNPDPVLADVIDDNKKAEADAAKKAAAEAKVADKAAAEAKVADKATAKK